MALHAGEHGSEHVDLAGRWTLDPLPLASAAVAALLFALGWRQLRRRGRADLASGGRAALFGAGLVVLLLALLSPLDPIGEEYLLSAHMLQHVLLGDVAPLLLVLGLSGTLALFVVPRPLLRAAGRNRPARAGLRFLTRPATAVVVWIAVMAGWHIPVLFEYALEHRWAHDLEHATMFLAGFLLWLQIAGAVPRSRMSHGRRAALAVAMLAVGMVISQTIFLADPLYSVYLEQPERLLGLSAKGDQVRAAMLMTTEQLLTLGTAAGLLVWTHVERAEEQAREERTSEDPPVPAA